ncbi:MAG: response regulator transcription factor [Alphaproteobacteria bacterium]|nr:response regulator transcription factor [Alphaproteobacteria bacterium]
MRRRIALVDDDRDLLAALTVGLEAAGFEVATYRSGEAALAGLAAQPADLVVLDIKMPGLDGLETLRRLRQVSDVPALFLTSKDAEDDEVAGLRLGADDFLRKPVSRNLLVERIRAILRRAGPPGDRPLERGGLSLDPTRHSCRWKGAEIPLTVSEFLILEALARRPGHVKSRAQLIEAAYPADADVDDRTVDSHIKRLRRKFEAIDPAFDAVETLYGIGYRYKSDHG